jgi:hypothetical protein
MREMVIGVGHWRWERPGEVIPEKALVSNGRLELRMMKPGRLCWRMFSVPGIRGRWNRSAALGGAPE